jgi:thioredoxin reductase (NADPH)
MKQLVADGTIDETTSAKTTEIRGSDGQLESVIIQPKDDELVEVEADHLLVFFGLAPILGPIADWGLDINRKTINVDTEKFETSVPGIYAVGDINF